MGMLVTLYLISINVYTTLDAPPGRGFSYLELWMVGMQIPILVALVEYSVILGFRKFQKEMLKTNEVDSKLFSKRGNKDAKSELESDNTCFLNIDMICLIISIVYIVVFCVCYWIFLKI